MNGIEEFGITMLLVMGEHVFTAYETETRLRGLL